FTGHGGREGSERSASGQIRRGLDDRCYAMAVRQVDIGETQRAACGLGRARRCARRNEAAIGIAGGYGDRGEIVLAQQRHDDVARDRAAVTVVERDGVGFLDLLSLRELLERRVVCGEGPADVAQLTIRGVAEGM